MPLYDPKCENDVKADLWSPEFSTAVTIEIPNIQDTCNYLHEDMQHNNNHYLNYYHVGNMHAWTAGSGQIMVNHLISHCKYLTFILLMTHVI